MSSKHISIFFGQLDGTVPSLILQRIQQDPTAGLTSSDVEELRKIYGWNEVLEKKVPEWIKIFMRYTRLVPVVLIVAALFSVLVVDSSNNRDWVSFGFLIFLLNLTVWVDYLGERGSKNAIKAVEALSAPICRCKRDNVSQDLQTRDLLPGDIVALRAGVIVPADGIVISRGHVSLDESSLTGEAMFIHKAYGDELRSGSVVQNGQVEMLITRTGKDSFFGKTIALLGKASNQPEHLRQMLGKAAMIITLLSFIFGIFLFFWSFLRLRNNKEDLNGASPVLVAARNAFVLIAAATPAAMPAVTTTVLAVGAKILSKEKAIVSRLSAIEEAAGIEVLFSDKTGTLTKNELTLVKEELVVEPNVTQYDLLLKASLAGTIVDPEPIDEAINSHADLQARERYTILEFEAFNPVKKYALAKVKTPEGGIVTICKGAPHIIRDFVAEGNPGEVTRIDRIILSKAERGLRTLGVCEQTEFQGAWKLIGYISLFDPPREDTAETLARAIEMGIDVKMITGDQQAIAVETARQLKIGLNIAGPEIWTMPFIHGGTFMGYDSFGKYVFSVNGFSGMHPEHKFNVVNALLGANVLVGMTGDGVNDAPALKLATVGIAVAGATEAAKQASDIVLLKPGLSTIITTFAHSRKIFRLIEAYITYRIFASMLILMFLWSTTVFLDYMFPSWTLVIISMVNDFTLISCSVDRVPSSSVPLKWSMYKVTVVAVTMAFFSAILLFTFVVIADPIFNVDWWTIWSLSPFIADTGDTPSVSMSSQTNAALWLLLTVLIQLSFHSCRTKGFFFLYGKHNYFPSWVILLVQSIALLATFILSIYWDVDWRFGTGSPMSGLDWGPALVTSLYGIVCFVLVDVSKVITYRLLSIKWADLSFVSLLTFGREEEYKARKRGLLRELIIEEMEKQMFNEDGNLMHINTTPGQAAIMHRASSPPAEFDYTTKFPESSAGAVVQADMFEALSNKVSALELKISEIGISVASLEEYLKKTK